MKKLDPIGRQRVREIHQKIKDVRRYLDGPGHHDCAIDRPEFNPAYTELERLIARAEVWSEELVFLVDTEHEPA